MFSFDFLFYLFFLLSFCGWVIGVIVCRYLNHHQEMMNETGRNVGRRNLIDHNRGDRSDNQHLNPSMNIPSIGN